MKLVKFSYQLVNLEEHVRVGEGVMRYKMGKLFMSKDSMMYLRFI